MRYGDDDRQSSNVEDRRGRSGGGFRMPGGFRFPGSRRGGRQVRIPMGGGRRGGFSIWTLLLIGAAMLFFGINPLDLLRGGGSTGMPDFGQVPQMPRMDPGQRDVANRNSNQLPGSGSTANSQDARVVFVRQVLADTEDVWNRVFRSLGKNYREPRLVLYRGAIGTACGTGQSAMGPFYCPGDQKIYIDLGFFDELKRKFGAPGDFAQAYVIAHEVGHHIQTQIGIAAQVQRMKRGRSRVDANRIQVRMELQADCLAGVWANLTDRMKDRLEPGDVEEGVRAAGAIGDDMIQRRTTGRVVPDAFTHGTSEQRIRWFRQGLETGQMQNCDTFRNRI